MERFALTDTVPEHVKLATITRWVESLNPGHVSGVIPMQFEYQCKPYGFNWAWVIAWAAVVTDNFRDKRWWDLAMLPDPSTGKWPEKGSQRWSLEIRFLCDRLVETLRREDPVYRRDDADREYTRLQELARFDREESRPEPETPTQPPPPPAPTPVPAPGAELPAPGKPAWLKQIAIYAAMLAPVVTFILWVAPIPGPVKDIIKWMLALLSGLGG
jgi:hypothetical protein